MRESEPLPPTGHKQKGNGSRSGSRTRFFESATEFITDAPAAFATAVTDLIGTAMAPSTATPQTSARRRQRELAEAERGTVGVRGSVRFAIGIYERRAQYLRVPPYAESERLNLPKQFGLSVPQLLVWVTGDTGSQRSLSLDRGLELTLKRGLASVARSTHTWVMTGGCDGGVMRWAGEAVSGNLGKGACIGIAPWRRIKDMDALQNSEVQNSEVPSYTAQGSTAVNDGLAALERHHTHFLLVDDEADDGWGTEIDLARRLRDTLCLTLQVPLVTLVIAGGIGNLADVLDALNCNGLGAAVVVVRESGGCAQALAEFVELWRSHGGSLSEGVITQLLDDFGGRLEELLIKGAVELFEANVLLAGKEPQGLLEEKQQYGHEKRQHVRKELMKII